MYAIAPDIQRLFDAGANALAVATTMRTWGSAPLPVGSAMAVAPDGAFAGAVSGGCVEAAVIAAAHDLLNGDGTPRRLAFDVGDETAWSVGLACGGRLEVWLERWTPAAWRVVADTLAAGATATLVRVVDGPPDAIGHRYLDGRWIATATGEAVATGNAVATAEAVAPGNAVTTGNAGAPGKAGASPTVPDAQRARDVGRTSDVFSVTLAPPPHIVLVGAGAIAVALASLAATMGRRVTIVDPRRSFATTIRFPAVETILHAWPTEALAALAIDSGTAIVVLSHDPKLDDPALEAALRSPAGYIGALGGQVSQAARRERLLARGWTPDDIGRIHGPVGLAIGARTPEEIAVAIIAQIIAGRARTPRTLGGGAADSTVPTAASDAGAGSSATSPR